MPWIPKQIAVIASGLDPGWSRFNAVAMRQAHRETGAIPKLKARGSFCRVKYWYTYGERTDVMPLFNPGNHTINPENAKLYAAVEIAYTSVDFAAAGLFIVGSVLFFNESTMNAGTWCFLLGSICFALKPTLRLGRELMYAKRDKVDLLAKRAEGSR